MLAMSIRNVQWPFCGYGCVSVSSGNDILFVVVIGIASFTDICFSRQAAVMSHNHYKCQPRCRRYDSSVTSVLKDNS